MKSFWNKALFFKVEPNVAYLLLLTWPQNKSVYISRSEDAKRDMMNCSGPVGALQTSAWYRVQSMWCLSSKLSIMKQTKEKNTFIFFY